MRVALLLVCLALPALADDVDTLKRRQHLLWGNTSLRLEGLGAWQSGVNPSQPGLGQYSRFTFGVGAEGGYLGLFTSLGTLQGLEGRVALGYGLPEQYTNPASTPGTGGVFLRAEAHWLFCPRFLRFNDWRVLALTGVGLEVDVGRWSDAWRAFAVLGLRGQLFFTETTSLSLTWGWMPGTLNQTFTLRAHQVEVLLALDAFHLGLRGQLDLAGSAAGPGVAWLGGLVAGYAL